MPDQTTPEEMLFAVGVVIQELQNLGVQPMTTFSDVTRPAEFFALKLEQNNSSDPVKEILEEWPEKAPAFLEALKSAKRELISICSTTPGNEDRSGLYKIAAQTVLKQTLAWKAKSTLLVYL